MNNRLPHRLRNARDEKGYLQKYVAKEIGIENNTISNYENGIRTPDPDMILQLARLYDVSTDYLLGAHDHKTPYVDDELEELIGNLRMWYGTGSVAKKKQLKQFKHIFETFKDDE